MPPASISAQTPPSENAAASAPASAILASTIFDWEKLDVIKTANGERREFVKSPTATFENFSCHVTTLEGGKIAHAPHRHPDEELVIVKEGTIEVMVNGATRQVGAGSMFFFASNDLHGMKNAGTSRASYFVIRIVTGATPAVAQAAPAAPAAPAAK
jgi:XRE family transcriptional regulator, regulator of sulfur utilization